MRLRLQQLELRTKQSVEHVDFSRVTFIHGPVGTGKSTVARLVDYCLGGALEWTPAIRHQFLSATLYLTLGDFDVALERGATDNSLVRVSWSGSDDNIGSVNAPLAAQSTRLVDAEVYNFSDLVFYLAGIEPIKVRKRSRDWESPMVRLSIRDLWAFSYLDQTHLDSSFFRLGDPIRARKSQDAMKFFTGLHSKSLSRLESELMQAVDDQRTKKQTVVQIRQFMEQFDLGSELDVEARLRELEQQLSELRARRTQLEATRSVDLHPTDNLRNRLRALGTTVAELGSAIADAETAIVEQKALRSELITAKTKAVRLERAGQLLDQVDFDQCPRCGSDVTHRPPSDDQCRLCGTETAVDVEGNAEELEAVRRDLNTRIDEIGDSVRRRETALARTRRQLRTAEEDKRRLDDELAEELARYDSAFVESIRATDREIATLEERVASFLRLQEMPRAIDELQDAAAALQGKIERLRKSEDAERQRLRKADANIAAIADRFRSTMLAVGFPGVSTEDEVQLDPRNWRPRVVHGDQAWDFWDTGSGGKKTLFNVCYALALHSVAVDRELPMPSVLIIDSPTKNISEDENPTLVRSLYDEVYRLASTDGGEGVQFLLIDSDVVEPEDPLDGFTERRMAGEPSAPSLIPHYHGP